MWNEFILKMVFVLCIVELELHVVLRLCLNEVYDYVKHVKCWFDEWRSKACIEVKCKWNDAYVKYVLTCTHTLTLKWIN